jgi:hypothetical protein
MSEIVSWTIAVSCGERCWSYLNVRVLLTPRVAVQARTKLHLALST